MMGKKAGTRDGFLGDLNGEYFPTMSSQVQSSSKIYDNEYMNVNVPKEDNVNDSNKMNVNDVVDNVNDSSDVSASVGMTGNVERQVNNAAASDNVGNKNVMNNVTDKNFVDTVNGKVDNTKKSESIVHLNNDDATAKEKYDINIVGEKNSNSMNRNKLVDIVTTARLDNTLLVIPTETNEKGNEGFGHDDISCRIKPKEQMEDKSRTESGVQDDTFQMQVKTAKNRQNNGKVEFRRKHEIGQGKLNGKEHSKDGGNSEGSNRSIAYESHKENTINANKYANVQASVGIKESNRFTILESLVNEEDPIPPIRDRKKVNEVIDIRIDPTVNEWESSTEDMNKYYEHKKGIVDTGKELANEEDVVNDIPSIDEGVLRNEVEGACNNLLGCILLYEKENINGQFLDHFKNFLGTKDIIPNFPTDSVIFENKLLKEEAERTVRPVMKDEIQKHQAQMDSLLGYFNGGRGLRQGDPISPYIFTIAMEVFNLLMKKNIENTDGFKLYYGCKKLKITHLGFVVDLIVFSHGDCNSVRWNLTKGKAKISWENICRPKDEAGLGLKNLQIWNEVLIMKHLWNVSANTDTLWVKWINVEKLKGIHF
nr:RNA-directed DNA polymerase, eukaryota, reverse transcriptase zinc-binding domain protein [Tanacetum cinerariifolium]